MRRQAHTNQAFFGNSPLSLRPSPQNWGKNIMGRDQGVRSPLATATWQAALWPGTGSSRTGASPRQRGFWEPASPERSTGQRGWKRQPIGMWAGSGGSPVKTLCSWRTLTFVPTKPASSALTRLYLPLRNLPLLGDAASLPYLLVISLFKAFSRPSVFSV